MSNEATSEPETLLTARACLYEFLSSVFSYPGTDKFSRLGSGDYRDGIFQACRIMDVEKKGAGAQSLECLAENVFAELSGSREQAENAYVVTFGHTVARDVSLYELEHLERQEAYYQTQWLADIQGFYRAFGLDVTAGTERSDHLCVQTEFMAFVSAKERSALLEHGPDERSQVCREVRQCFLNDHLGVWGGHLAKRLAGEQSVPYYRVAGNFLETWLAAEMWQKT